ncbi:MAG: cation transporter [Verrucomicrobia bacterium]|nr:cation transporter [Verrucomicrobiota bacterium]
MSADHQVSRDSSAAHVSRLKLALVLTGSFLIIEVVGGLWTGSLALLSDAAHMLTDVSALILALVAIRVGKRAADAKRTFGYYRFEILAAAFNAVVLFLVAFYILYEAYQRFRQPPVEIASGWMLAIAAAGLVINLISMSVLRSGSTESLNVKGAYLEVWSDMLGSIAVIVAALIIKLTGWWPIDPILGVLIGFWVLPRTWTLLNESLNVLLEGVPDGIELQKIHDALAALPGVTEVHDLHVWSLTSGRNSLTVHLVAPTATGDAGFALVRSAQAIAAEHKIEHASIQVEDAAQGPLEHDSHPSPWPASGAPPT